MYELNTEDERGLEILGMPGDRGEILRAMMWLHDIEAEGGDWICCNSCGHHAMTEMHGEGAHYVFWNVQSDEFAFDDEGNLVDSLWIAHSGGAAARFTVQALREAGYGASWSGDEDECIEVKPAA